MQEFKLKNQTKNLLYSLISEHSQGVAELETICREAFEQIERRKKAVKRGILRRAR